MREENTNRPFITVGIASYNYARFLPRAFEAIRRQKFTDFEVLYCDDGSTDDSAVVIERFIQENPDMRIRLICGKNAGVMENKNRILENALGEYVMLCDADDWMDDTCLEKLAAAARRGQPDRVIAGFRNMIETNGKMQLGQVENLPAHPSKWNQFQHHGCLYRLAVCQENNIYFRPDHYPDDFDFVERFNVHCKNVAFVDDALYNFYHNGLSTSSTKDPTAPWYYLNLLRDIASLTAELLAQLTGQDYWELEAAVLRIFYARLPDVKNRTEYRQYRNFLQSAMPDYRENPLLRKDAALPFRPDAARKARIMLAIDQFGGLYPAAAILHHLQ